MKIFAISLSSSLDRRAELQKQCDANGQEVTFVDAIDGRAGLPIEYEAFIDREKALQSMGLTMTDAEFACALSHALLCKKISEDTECDGAIILEDDAILTDDFFKLLRSDTLEKLDEKLILFFHTNARVNKFFRGRFFEKYILRHPIKAPFGAVAYFVSRIGAKEIYESSMPIARVADWGVDFSQIGAKCVHPIIVKHPKIQSEQTTIKKRERPERASLFAKLLDSHYLQYALRKLFSDKIS